MKPHTENKMKQSTKYCEPVLGGGGVNLNKNITSPLS